MFPEKDSLYNFAVVNVIFRKSVMVYYWYINSRHQKTSPFSLEALKRQDIKEDTMVWHDGLERWIEASRLNDLEGMFPSSSGLCGSPTSVSWRIVVLIVLSVIGILTVACVTQLAAMLFHTAICTAMATLTSVLLLVFATVAT